MNNTLNNNASNSHKASNKFRTEHKPYKRRNKSDLGPDFVAPDSGWAWVVCIASGFTTFCIFTPVQQYGIIYRQRMYDLGFDAKQITTIINSELATAAVTGIINGALFRRFTFRQAAFVGAFLVFLGTLLTAFCTHFWQYLFCFTCLYGIGLGMNLSAMALAVNTYFKEHRRRATGFSSTITGLGPIILPHICTILLQNFGTQGTILLIAAFSLNALACALTLQPVLWHVKAKKKPNEFEMQAKEKAETVELTMELCQYCQQQEQSKWNIFAADKLQTDFEDTDYSGCEISEFGTPTLANFNDGLLSSMESLNTIKSIKLRSLHNGNKNYELLEKNGGHFKSSKETEDRKLCSVCKEITLKQNINEEELIFKPKLNFKQKCVKFFDLDLLTDWTFVNLVQGMTIMMFCELNFSFLTPFILASYGYSNAKISLAMSLLAGVDIVVRFTAPLVLEKVKFGNNALFAFGILIGLIGRMLVTIVDSYYVLLAIFMFIGFGKGFRTIFGPLIIPSYVPLNRLAAASGLQLFLNAIFTFAIGPILGVIADISSYTFLIHFINFLTIFSLSLWLIEWLLRRFLYDSNKRDEVT